MLRKCLGFLAIFPDRGLVSVLLRVMARNKQRNGGFRGSMIQNAQLRTAHAKGRPARSDPSDIGPELERRWFEFDRNAVLRQIEMAQGALDENANELEMVAVEGVFEKSLSDELSRTSRSLYAISQELGALRGLVARASGYPKADKKRP
jgi:hypothetical protein